MAVGILLITHPRVGSALVDVATRLLGALPLSVVVLDVPCDSDPEALLPQASTALRKVDGGHGVMVLTDMYGATPSNLAAKLAHLGTPVRRVSGLNLPMLLRVMNYAELDLHELPEIAASGARNGVLLDDA